MKRTLLSLTFLFALTITTFSHAATVEYSSGHGDIGLAYEDDGQGAELELHYHFADGAVLDGTPLPSMTEIEYDPNEAHVRVGDNTMQTTLGDLMFLGTTLGDSIWLLPQGNETGKPFLGIATEELAPEMGEPALFSGATLSLTSFSGPGEFALWQTNGIGVNTVHWQSFDDGTANPNTLNLAIGVHDHFNYGFTAEGVYDIGISAVAEFADGVTPDAEDFGVLRFVVGSSTPVPEPGSFALATIAACGIALSRRRRHHVSLGSMD